MILIYIIDSIGRECRNFSRYAAELNNDFSGFLVSRCSFEFSSFYVKANAACQHFSKRLLCNFHGCHIGVSHKIKSAYKPSGPSGRSLSRFL